jgi:hypothetical protein
MSSNGGVYAVRLHSAFVRLPTWETATKSDVAARNGSGAVFQRATSYAARRKLGRGTRPKNYDANWKPKPSLTDYYFRGSTATGNRTQAAAGATVLPQQKPRVTIGFAIQKYLADAKSRDLEASTISKLTMNLPKAVSAPHT